jgi:general nucleoside transport system permease protein
MEFAAFSEFFLSVLRSSSPLFLAAAGALFCERSGVVQIALEGLMLVGAFAAAAVATGMGGGAGLLMAGMVGLVVAFFYAYLVIRLKVDQIIAGTVINMLAWGGLPIICKALFNSSAGTPQLGIALRLSSAVPIILAFLVVWLGWFIFSKTSFGLWVTFAGENPEALKAAGLNPENIRYGAILIGGFIAGIAGGCLSVCLSSSYTRNMTAGRGFMALAALILGQWKPVPVFLSCMLFGFCDVLQMNLQGVPLPIIGVVPNQIIQLTPYIMTLILLVGVISENQAPSKLGRSS